LTVTQTSAANSNAPINESSAVQIDYASPGLPGPIASKIAIVLFFLLGLFFAASALAKAVAYQDFLNGIALYRVVTEPSLVRLAGAGTLAIETILAVALLFRLWPRQFTLPLGLILLAVFTGLIAYAWKYHSLEDCTCFGNMVTMGPLASIIKNLILMTLLAWLWFMSGPSLVPQWTSRRFAAAGLLFVALGALNIGLAKPEPQPQDIAKSTTIDDGDPRGPYGYLVKTEDGQEFDLEVGDYLVCLLSATCEHCMAAVPKLNQMQAEVEGFPQIVGLCLGDAASLANFREETFPEFPTRLIPDLEFLNLLKEKPPKFVALLDGKIMKAWEAEEPPPGHEIIEALWLTQPTDTDQTSN
jgi:hypothetical protein